MELTFKRIANRASFVNIHEKHGLAMGFTEAGFRIDDFQDMFPGYPLVHLKQIHSNIIVPAPRAEDGREGDGLTLREKKIIAVIKTADCVPLFFWDDSFTIAGILHVGWKGLLYGIEQELLNILSREALPLKRFSFATGPAIESTCYEVGLDLYEKFSSKEYRDKIFSPKGDGKFWLNIKRGITLSLAQSGIGEHHILHSPLCTSCLYPRFPSYRKNGKTGQRIYNFILLK